MKILKWAVISTSMSIIPCLNSMFHGFSQRPKTNKTKKGFYIEVLITTKERISV